jgi:hypothetical protein
MEKWKSWGKEAVKREKYYWHFGKSDEQKNKKDKVVLFMCV